MKKNMKKVIIITSIFAIILMIYILVKDTQKELTKIAATKESQKLDNEIMSIDEEKYTTVTNLYNYKTDDSNHVVAWDGALNESEKNRTSDYIAVNPGENYAGRFWNSEDNTAYKLCYYDADKNFIKRISNEEQDYVTIPDNVYYVRIIISQSSSVYKYFVFCKGTQYYDRLEYGKVYKVPLNDKEGYVAVNPSELYECTTEYVEALYGWNHLQDLYNMWDELVSKYPNYITMDVIGEFEAKHPLRDEVNTYEIRCYTISSKIDEILNNTSERYKIIYISGIHGHERNAQSGDYMFFKDLIENHSTNGALNKIWQNADFKVIPTSNPWGYNFSYRVNANGVDLNRNFESSEWTYVDKETGGNNYSGETANSEIETQIIEKFLSDNSDAFFVVNRHTNSTLADSKAIGSVNVGYATDRAATIKTFRTLAAQFKSNYSWLISDKPDNLNKNLLNVWTPSSIGNMDNYYREILGMHGGLLEIGGGLESIDNNKEAVYPTGTEEEYDVMCVEVIGNYLLSYILNSENILEDVVEPTEEIYQIIYNLNGGTLNEQTNPSIYMSKTETIILNNPTKEGYIFTGWTEEDSESSQIEVRIEKGTKGNKMYTANWEVASYTLTINPNGGKYKDQTANYTCVQNTNTEIQIEEPVPPEGYEVIFDANEGTVDTTNIVSTKSFDKWILTNGAGKLEGNVYTFGEGNGTIMAEYINNSITLPSAIREEYIFEGWYKEKTFENEVGKGEEKFTPTENITLYAKWTQIYIESSTQEIDEENKIISLIAPNTTLKQLRTELKSSIIYEIVDVDENLLEETDIIKTGCKLKLANNRIYTLVVLGDCNGDGQADLKDILTINKHRLNKVGLIGEYLMAGDVTGDGISDLKDILQINKFRLGKIDTL